MWVNKTSVLMWMDSYFTNLFIKIVKFSLEASLGVVVLIFNDRKAQLILKPVPIFLPVE